MKIDLHVHSSHSTRPSQWVLQKLGCPESFTTPHALYRLARKAGMDMVTITDHNTISGALEIAHLPDAFVSVEITTYFPEDRCKVHVLALNITEADFAEIRRARENIFDLVPLLRSRKITHACAHPLFAVNGRLRLEHVERLLLLFTILECNGARDNAPNIALRRIVAGLTPNLIEGLADKHGIEPGMDRPWEKYLIGGSDDHGGLNIARMHTVVSGAATLEAFFLGLEQGRARPEGEPAQPETLARNLYGIAYQYFKSKFGFERYVKKDIFLKFVERFLGVEDMPNSSMLDRICTSFSAWSYSRNRKAAPKDLPSIVRGEAARLVCGDLELSRIAKGIDALPLKKGDAWYRFMNRASNTIMRHFADNALARLTRADLFSIFHSIGSAGALYAFLTPYFLSYALFHQDRSFSGEVLEGFGLGRGQGETPLGDVRAGCYVDHLLLPGERMADVERFMDDEAGVRSALVMCGPKQAGPKQAGMSAWNRRLWNRSETVRFQPVGAFGVQEYPDFTLFYPPILEMIRHAFDSCFGLIKIATPGPLGLMGLLVARLFKLPAEAFYHPRLPEALHRMTQDAGLEDMTWKYLAWFYAQMDAVVTTSEEAAEEIAARGVGRDKIRVEPTPNLERDALSDAAVADLRAA